MASSFLSRWSKRKLEQDQEVDFKDEINSINSGDDAQSTARLDAEDLTPSQDKSDAVTTSELDSSHQVDTTQVEPKSVDSNQLEASTDEEELSVASLLATGADKAVKKAALRKLFLGGEFSEVDALNDYDHDYSAVKSLSSDVASQLRGWVKEQVEDITDELDAQGHTPEIDSAEEQDVVEEESNLKEFQSTAVEDEELVSRQSEGQQAVDETQALNDKAV